MLSAIISGIVTLLVVIMVCGVALAFAGVAVYGIMVAGLVKFYRIFCEAWVKLFNEKDDD